MNRSRRLAVVGLVILLGAVTFLVGIGLHLAAHPEQAHGWLSRLKGEQYLGPNPEGVLQERGYDCGPAAVRIALLHFGVKASLADLGLQAGTTREGTSMEGLRLACARHGVRAQGWQLTYENLLHSPLPAIAQVDGDHFIVLKDIDAFGVVAHDPMVGTIRMSRTTFEPRWRGYTLLLAREDLPPP